jgi:hypothetical protein
VAGLCELSGTTEPLLFFTIASHILTARGENRTSICSHLACAESIYCKVTINLLQSYYQVTVKLLSACQRGLTKTHSSHVLTARGENMAGICSHLVRACVWFYRCTSLIRNRPPPLGPPYEPRHGPTVGSHGVALSDKRGTPVRDGGLWLRLTVNG